VSPVPRRPDAYPRGPRSTQALLAGVLVATCLASLAIGTTAIPLRVIVEALLAPDGSREHVVVATQRLPRVLIGCAVGASLACAGAVMQAVTNNPLASPGLLGVNAGAAFAVVMAIVTLGAQSDAILVWYAFGGAAVSAAIVYGLGSAGRAGATPLRLALAGAIVTSFLGSITATVLVFDQSTLDNVRLWTAGTLSGRSMQTLLSVGPYIGLGLAAALALGRQVTTLGLGAEIARLVGQNQALWRGIAALLVVLLAGSAVALAGPVGFVGLVVPHVARMVVGTDYRHILPACMLGGATLLVAADAAVRLIMPEQDLPVGVTMALIGAPFFVYLARSRIGAVR
jgi:iron complex transport system permease protein